MIECGNCGCEIDEEDVEFECPYCGSEDGGDGFFRCPDCGTLIDWGGDEWECFECENRGLDDEDEDEDDDDMIYRQHVRTCPDCGAEMYEDEYCDECGSPDVNLGWVGENYG